MVPTHDAAGLHHPVMLDEVIQHLKLQAGQIIVDATVGMGGHAAVIAERIAPTGRLICIDRDSESLTEAKGKLSDCRTRCEFVHGNFAQLDEILQGLKVEKIDGILFDLGVSSFQLASAQRGFSFQQEGPLDMRLDRNSYISAYDLINNLHEEEISALLWNFGGERWHNRIARLVVRERQARPIATTAQLSQLVVRAIPHRFRHGRIHPATRTFQAVRIAVNRELEALETALGKAVGALTTGGRICTIAFHSLEDRIVKLSFRRFASDGIMQPITPKPLTPTLGEIKENPPSRSAKLRVGERG
jgi:16S rRNA (cytosine1402-N4)-methyltransferase